MTAAEWLDREIDAGRLPANPPEEALSLAADVLGSVPATTTKAPWPRQPSAFISSVEGGGDAPASTSAA